MTQQNMHSETVPARRGRGLKYLAAALLCGVAAAAIGAYVLQVSSSAADLPPPPPPAVTVSTPLQENAAGSTVFTGQFSAVDQVDIRAQVSGYLTEIRFTDGAMVHKGDLLFVIDPRPYQIQLDQANAAVQSAQAQLLFAAKETYRIGALQDSGAVTKEQYDQRVEDQAGAQAALLQAKAAVAAAELNLEFCHITAPFTGRISTHRVSVGNLVLGGAAASSSTLLTTIVSLDPIYLDIQMSEDDYLNYERYVHAAKTGGPADNSVAANLSGEPDFARTGQLTFVDNELDPSSGTIHARATFSNHDFLITPGAFGQLQLTTSAPRPVLLVPDLALQADQSNEVAMTVAADGTVVPKIVQTGSLSHGFREILSGLSPRDEVIIVGLMRATPGAKVTPQPGNITAAAQN